MELAANCMLPSQAQLLRFRLMLQVRLVKNTKPRPSGMLQPQNACKAEYIMSSHYIWLQTLHFRILFYFFKFNFIISLPYSDCFTFFSDFKISIQQGLVHFRAFHVTLDHFIIFTCFRILSLIFSFSFHPILLLSICFSSFPDLKISLIIILATFRPLKYIWL